jgi:hypothetical protein
MHTRNSSSSNFLERFAWRPPPIQKPAILSLNLHLIRYSQLLDKEHSPFLSVLHLREPSIMDANRSPSSIPGVDEVSKAPNYNERYAGNESSEEYDLLGIGFGPANLAIAVALLEHWDQHKVSVRIPDLDQVG